MKATTTFLPSANSPRFVLGPSAIICPFLTLSPALTIGDWLVHSPWLALSKVVNVYTSSALAFFTTIFFAST